jgi:pyrimidine-nucleoside phosphorylase
VRAVDLIRAKRDGGVLSADDLAAFIAEYVAGGVPDYQMAAFLMAVVFRGMTPEETGALTRAMIASGETIDLAGLRGPLIDKHSTGGVGDKVSLVLAPVAAACGLQVPMMSGRSLGHTGGTLDKLESIPGYRTDLDADEFRACIAETGFAMIGQSERVVPADRRMYALRDVTATVESIPLITASILSKKFAEGAQGLVFDVKTGSGAFMRSQQDAEALAASLHAAGKALGRKVSVAITSMEQPLGRAAGNLLEVRESVDALEGRGPDDLSEVTLRLAAHMLVLGGLCDSLADGERKAAAALADGSAREAFARNVRRQGGDLEAALDPGRRAPVIAELAAPRDGVVARLDAFRVGMVTVHLGAGRARQGDAVHPDVGVVMRRKVGERCARGEPLAEVHARDRAAADAGLRGLADAYTITGSAPGPRPLIVKEIQD